MKENITVDHAISKGHLMVNFPVILIIIGINGITIYLGIQKNILFWYFPISIIISLGLAWLWWSIMITKWRLWAFDNVRNVHELKNRAIQEKLIWPDNSIYEKTEIRNAIEKEKWKRIKQKFNQKDVFRDDLTIQYETTIYYSKGGNIVEMVFMLICLGYGIYLLLNTENYILGLVFSLIGAYFSFKEYKEATNTEPQIILNEKGIKTISTAFYVWAEIENEEIISEGSGKNIQYYLVYDHPNGSEHLKIDDYETNPKILSKLLKIYRGRSKKNTTKRK